MESQIVHQRDFERNFQNIFGKLQWLIRDLFR